MDRAESPDDLDGDVFGPLITISPESLILLAKNIRSKVFEKSTAAGRLLSRIGGSYNLVHIIQLDDFKLVVQLPATGWGNGMNAAAAHALESQVVTLHLLSRKTTIPVPEIYAFDTTNTNEIGYLYICMSFISGQAVSKAWFDDTTPTLLEDRRLRILTFLSQSLAQLSKFSFEKIGSLHEEVDGSLIVGPCYDWQENDDNTVNIVESSPFDTLAAYL